MRTHGSKFSTQVDWSQCKTENERLLWNASIQQIDTMSAVASAFFLILSMPAQQNETWT
jgi:hypothetical protein